MKNVRFDEPRASVERKGRKSLLRGLARGVSVYDGDLDDDDKDQLYGVDALIENPDPLTGVAPTHYADIEMDNSPNKTDFHGSQEFAVIAFWEADMEKDRKFDCKRFFIVPIPMKREIQNSDGTRLN